MIWDPQVLIKNWELFMLPKWKVLSVFHYIKATSSIVIKDNYVNSMSYT